MNANRLRVAVGAILLSASLPACNFNKFAADQTAGLLTEAAPAIDGFWDYDMAGLGTPGAIMQLEAFHAVTPDNEALSLNLAKAYVGYAVGWVESEYEVAYANGDMDKSDHLRQRARLLYERARNLALHALRVRDKGIDAALKASDENTLPKYLSAHYKDKKDDIGPVFWAGLAWGAAINMSLDDPSLLAELPTAKALVTHAKNLDDVYFNGGAYVFLGSMESAFPKAMGGDPEKGKALFEQGLSRTGRRNHMMLVNYARVYAVNTQDRALFVQLLNEVINAPDQGTSVRLSNKVARRRAERYLTQGDQWF
ncbi:MAG TPA: TRAP transporter TatT component family protein [Polyangiales bacterium]|nr:TRAP transporter TatT component family protein [Polyangiales bacterium]